MQQPVEPDRGEYAEDGRYDGDDGCRELSLPALSGSPSAVI